MVESKSQRRARLERTSHVAKNLGESFTKMRQIPALGVITGQLILGTGRRSIKARSLTSYQLAQPGIAEIHQLGILDIAEIGGIGKDGIEGGGG